MEIVTLATAPQNRQQGLAGGIIELLKRYSTGVLNCKHIVVTAISNDYNAISFWKHMGFSNGGCIGKRRVKFDR